MAVKYLQCLRASREKVQQNTAVRRLLHRPGMDGAEFDRLVARAGDPRLISGIYNYCDGRCQRCPFTQRCLAYIDSQETKAARGEEGSTAEVLNDSLRRMLEMLKEAAQRTGVDLDDREEEIPADGSDFERHRNDPLAISAREYGSLAWRIGRAVAPIAAARGDEGLVEAAETIEWFSSMVSSKVWRAICGRADGWERSDEVQTDFNGSAKIALIGIAESRHAWAVLMEAGRATANGVPARAVRMLEELDAAIRQRFPRVMGFVRPGFDEPTGTPRTNESPRTEARGLSR
jgi:hypothetical protein